VHGNACYMIGTAAFLTFAAANACMLMHARMHVKLTG
jgi:hypothetical protein